MQSMGLNEIRQKFEDFWVSKGHLAHGSYPLIPQKDKSLLLINAGMAPLKPYFSGAETPPAKRMTTHQKCIRTGDIDNVGHTARHATFFEMLGNFSFGDYFKKEAIVWGWEFITKWLGLPADRIWATIYVDDDEAHDIWLNEVGMPEERIVRLGKEDNFWEIGTGPCGPCSEVYYDRGPEYGCGKPDCKPGCDCDRYMEFWNYVFTQFDRQEDGSYVPLSHPNIDTGMGLERIACIMQGVDSIYNVDTMRSILEGVVAISGVPYTDGASPLDVSTRVVTDHVRTLSFMIADGILPSNEGRGYVLRRLLRRAARHGRLLGIKGPFLTKLVDKVIENYGEAYKELVERRDYIKKIILIEEEKFAQTIEQGSDILDQYLAELKESGKTQLSGEAAFRLYDTYGFPLELTQEIAADAGCTVDADGFAENMKMQKKLAREARKSEDNEGWKDDSAIFSDIPDTVFTGYETLCGKAKILAIAKASGLAETAEEGEQVRLVLDRTPFYAESGGQAGDRGVLEGAASRISVEDTTKLKNLFIHKATVVSGEISVGDEIDCAVDVKRRNSAARNHTATHLLQKALQTVLGSHVAQAGSQVTPEGLRFDFTHFEAVSPEDLRKVEDMVNDEIIKFTDVTSEVMPIDEARKLGAMALFGEKYGSEVRVVSIGDFSKELCGGTHVANIGQIGAFRIVSETGIAAGVRRIEAVTGLAVRDMLEGDEKLVSGVSEILKTNPAGLVKRAESLSEELKAVKKELEQLKKESLNAGLSDILAGAKDVKGVRLVAKTFDGKTIDELRSISDSVKESEKSVVMVFAATAGDKATMMVSVTDDLLDKGLHAGNMIKQLAKVCGGGGGGKADMAQAGARDASKLPEAFELAEKLIAEALG